MHHKKTKSTPGKHRKCIYRFRLTRLSKRHSSFVTMTQCRKLCDSTMDSTARACGLRTQIRSNSWIRGLIPNGFFYSQVEMLRSQWIASKYCMQYDRLSQQQLSFLLSKYSTKTSLIIDIWLVKLTGLFDSLCFTSFLPMGLTYYRHASSRLGWILRRLIVAKWSLVVHRFLKEIP